MEDKIFLSIVIPTYNRAIFLESLLNCISSQVKDLQDSVEICISNNCSTDNTKDVVMQFSEKYPGLIKYRENEKNLGFNRNMFKAIHMPKGKFVWFFCDDDTIVSDGIKKVIDFLKNISYENTGFASVATRSYFIDNKTGKQITYSKSTEESKLKVYELDLKDVMGQTIPTSVFTPSMIFNNYYLGKILEEEKELLKTAVEAGEYIQTFLYRLLFLKFSDLKALRINEEIINEEAHRYKFFVEDIFQLHYITWVKLCDILLSCKYMKNDYKKEAVLKDKNNAVRIIITEMGLMNCFGAFNYSSFLGCIKMFFKESPFLQAILFSEFFIIFSISPSFILRNLYKNYIKFRHKENWQKVWLYITVKNSEMSKGDRRLYD